MISTFGAFFGILRYVCYGLLGVNYLSAATLSLIGFIGQLRNGAKVKKLAKYFKLYPIFIQVLCEKNQGCIYFGLAASNEEESLSTCYTKITEI